MGKKNLTGMRFGRLTVVHQDGYGFTSGGGSVLKNRFERTGTPFPLQKGPRPRVSI